MAPHAPKRRKIRGDNIGETRNLPKRRVRGEKVPNTVDLTPNLQKHLPPSVAATRSCADDGEEPAVL
jgi:hypothetical protein